MVGRGLVMWCADFCERRWVVGCVWMRPLGVGCFWRDEGCGSVLG